MINTTDLTKQEKRMNKLDNMLRRPSFHINNFYWFIAVGDWSWFKKWARKLNNSITNMTLLYNNTVVLILILLKFKWLPNTLLDIFKFRTHKRIPSNCICLQTFDLQCGNFASWGVRVTYEINALSMWNNGPSVVLRSTLWFRKSIWNH